MFLRSLLLGFIFAASFVAISCTCSRSSGIDSLKERVDRFEKNSSLPLSLYMSDVEENRNLRHELSVLCSNSKRLAYSPMGCLIQLMNRAYSVDGNEYDVLMITQLDGSYSQNDGQLKINAYPVIISNGPKIESIRIGQGDTVVLTLGPSSDLVLSLEKVGLDKPRWLRDDDFSSK